MKIILNLSTALLITSASFAAPIDRQALVSRHNVILTKMNGSAPLQVGNGEFAFGMDITGLQTFVPFNTMSQWGWHTSPLPRGQKVEDYKGQILDTNGRPIWYPMEDPNNPEVSAWLAANPHRINLGRIGLVLTRQDGNPAQVEDLKNPRQKLDLWTGVVTSSFEFEGSPVQVVTACHPTMDAIAVKITSPLIKTGRIGAYVSCPGNNPLQFANFVGDWSHPGIFERRIAEGKKRIDLTRRMDNAVYHATLAWSGNASLQPTGSPVPPLEIVKAEYGAADKWVDVTTAAKGLVRDGRLQMHASNQLGEPIHGVKKSLRVTYLSNGKPLTAQADENEDVLIDSAPWRSRVTLMPGKDDPSFSFICAFSPKSLGASVPTSEATIAASQKQWPLYWKSGGAIDLSGSADPRWKELERRIVLSQYQMKVNEAGSLPPQESGLVNNGWYGRFHLEMVWWHETHWALWNRWPELNRSIGFYKDLLPNAMKLAAKQGYKGARWPKCIGPNGTEWPHPIHAMLIWQQPHPIFFAELDYRAHPTKKTLEKWMPIVEATADFLSSYAFFDKAKGQYVLGPNLHVVSENTDAYTTKNPAFELGYWRYGLRTAQAWRQRLGKTRNADWDRVLKGLAPFPQQDGVYVLYEGVEDMWTKFNFEHPALIGTYGMLPGDGVDKLTFTKTLNKIADTWRFEEIWGWDFPMLAMAAARSGQTDKAIDYLLHPAARFQYDERGLATGGPFPYFPSNGGLLYAVAMMAAGWDGAPKKNAPGFPSKWKVRYENLSMAP